MRRTYVAGERRKRKGARVCEEGDELQVGIGRKAGEEVGVSTFEQLLLTLFLSAQKGVGVCAGNQA